MLIFYFNYYNYFKKNYGSIMFMAIIFTVKRIYKEIKYQPMQEEKIGIQEKRNKTLDMVIEILICLVTNLYILFLFRWKITNLYVKETLRYGGMGIDRNCNLTKKDAVEAEICQLQSNKQVLYIHDENRGSGLPQMHLFLHIASLVIS